MVLIGVEIWIDLVGSMLGVGSGHGVKHSFLIARQDGSSPAPGQG